MSALHILRYFIKYYLFKPWKYKEFCLWIRSLSAGASPLSLRLPWINFSAINFLVHELSSARLKVFEFGSGGSTLFFLRNNCDLWSVEHDSQWLDKVLVLVKDNGYVHRWIHFLAEPEAAKNILDYADPASCTSICSGELNGLSFNRYVNAVSTFQDHFFDLILIDGRARRSCIWYAAKKVKIGGIIMLDNSERPYYLQGPIELLSGFRLIHKSEGLCPCLLSEATQAIAWKRIS